MFCVGHCQLSHKDKSHMLDLLHPQPSHAFALSRRARAGCTIGQMVPPMPDAGVGPKQAVN